MNKKCMRFILNSIVLLLALSAFFDVPIFAIGRQGYAISNIDSSLGTVIVDFNYTYNKGKELNYQPYQSRYVSDKSGHECVGFAYARAEEKLNTTSLFNSNTDSAKELASKNTRLNGQERESSTGEKYIIRVYTEANEIKSNLSANAMVCFEYNNSGNSAGHVVFVEEVISSGTTKYVYYTEGAFL